MSEEAQDQETGGTGQGPRSVSMTRTGFSTYKVRNARGGTITIGGGDTDDFTPVELLLTAVAGCSAVDVDYITSRRAEPTTFEVTSQGEKLKDEQGNHMGEITVTFTVRFPDGDDGDSARAMLPRAIAQSRDRLCTVSRTVQLPTPVTMREA